MQIPVEIEIPFLWSEKFVKNDWGPINYIVGANGSGKSLFIEKLIPILEKHSLKVRYLNSDRLVSWIKQQNAHYINMYTAKGLDIGQTEDYKKNSRKRGIVNDAFLMLRDNPEIKIKVESTLSQLLNRAVFMKEIGGFLDPQVSTGNGNPYSFKENESHGLKMLITMLTFLHDDSYDCLVVDEPELHLHPQYQSFLIQEVRKRAGDPKTQSNKKCFFFATHAPQFIDIRTIEELKNCIIFQPNKLPKYLGELEPQDSLRLNQLLPKLNTHHKQFFFSPRPIFVEGYTDQQIFSLIQEKRHKPIGSAGTSFIDVNGKNELNLFFKLCEQLSIEGQFVLDLDGLFTGILRETVSKNDGCKTSLQKRGIGTEFMKVWNEILQKAEACVKDFILIPFSDLNTKDLKDLHHVLTVKTDLDKRRYSFILAVMKIRKELLECFKTRKDDITFIAGRIDGIIEAFTLANVYVLSEGELENYCPVANHFEITDNVKDIVFVSERDYLLQNELTEEVLLSRYGKLLRILDSVTGGSTVDFKPALLRRILEFINKVQEAVHFGDITDEKTLKAHLSIGYATLFPVIEVLSFNMTGKSFRCKVRINGFKDIIEEPLEFTEETQATKFELPVKEISTHAIQQ